MRRFPPLLTAVLIGTSACLFSCLQWHTYASDSAACGPHLTGAAVVEADAPPPPPPRASGEGGPPPFPLWSRSPPPPPDPPAFRVASWNVRVPFPFDSESGNSWESRRAYVAQAIDRARPDALGLQEDCYFMSEELMNDMGLAGQYDRYGLFNRNGEDGRTRKKEGRGREGWPKNAFTNDTLRDGEHNSVWWRRERFELVSNHTFWLSATPYLAGSSFGEVTGRVVNCALLRDRHDGEGRILQLCSAHFPNDALLARMSAPVLFEEMRRLRRERERHAGRGIRPIDAAIAVGDFNSPPSSEAYGILSGAGRFADARALSIVPARIVVATPAGADTPANVSTTAWYMAKDNLIDHIWIQFPDRGPPAVFPLIVDSVSHIPVHTTVPASLDERFQSQSTVPSWHEEKKKIPGRFASDHMMIVADVHWR